MSDQESQDRRTFLRNALPAPLAAAGVAGKVDTAGTTETEADKKPAYKPTDHNYAMGIDPVKCIGCGRCADACKKENDVPREPFYFRTWVERYIIQTERRNRGRQPQRRHRRLPASAKRNGHPADLLRAQAVQPLREPAVRAGLPGGGDLHHAGRRGAGGQGLLHRLPLLHPGLPVRRALPPSPSRKTAEKCTFCYHRVTQGAGAGLRRGVSHRGADLRRVHAAQQPLARFMRFRRDPGAEAAPEHRAQGLLRQPRRGGEIGMDPSFNAARGAAAGHGLHLPQRVRAAVEPADRRLPVPHRTGGGRLHPGVARAGLQRARRCSRPTGCRC